MSTHSPPPCDAQLPICATPRVKVALLTILLPAAPPAADQARKWTTTSSGLQIQVVTPGVGPSAQPGDLVRIHETTTLHDGTVLHSTRTKGNPLKFLVELLPPKP